MPTSGRVRAQRKDNGQKEGADAEELYIDRGVRTPLAEVYASIAHASADDGNDPVDRARGCPADPKEADGDGEGTDARRLEADLGFDATVLALLELGLDDFACVDAEGADGEHDADEDAHVSQANLARVEAMVALEDERE